MKAYDISALSGKERYFCAGIANELSELRPDVVSVELVGSTAERIVKRDSTSGDWDFLVLLSTAFPRGAMLFEPASLRAVVERSSPWHSAPAHVSYNGAPIDRSQQHTGQPTAVDIVPQRILDIQTKAAHAILDVAKRYRVLLHGVDLYEELDELRVTTQLLSERIEITLNYIDREAERGNLAGTPLCRYLGKAAILLSSCLFVEDFPTLDKAVIAKHASLLVPELHDELMYFLSVMSEPESYLEALCDVHQAFLSFTDHLMEAASQILPVA